MALMNADGTEFRNLFFGNAAGKPAWSPDGMQIAFESSGTIMVMSANGGAATPIGPADSHNPAWSPEEPALLSIVRRSRTGRASS